jgi:hypothetical protein
MTKPTAEDYAPHHELAEFWHGYWDYNAGKLTTFEEDGEEAQQAYDRGREFAMRLKREGRG